LKRAIKSAKKGAIINADDESSANLNLQSSKISYFGVSKDIRKNFPTDSELIAIEESYTTPYNSVERAVKLQSYDDKEAVFVHNNKRYSRRLQIKGGYNYQNATAAAATLLKILPKTSFADITDAIAKVQPAFGRGEEVIINGKEITY
jgi:UDP-N-acetylmuramyl tripeptide synthase